MHIHIAIAFSEKAGDRERRCSPTHFDSSFSLSPSIHVLASLKVEHFLHLSLSEFYLSSLFLLFGGGGDIYEVK